ncbi:2-methylfumaryl-CoA hydratase [Natronobeatus ordinarius]|uniref:2-methylfumaryl-CoA hydratase n=1 Tax=Natronobeatus ordinarius TaxID=2963433 RepID=UPI0020CE04A7|nr:2-methylfumaryl-CoA hydratase [Natronobeatus ordinarius]
MTDWTDPDTFTQALEQAETKAKGNCFEDFEEGQVIDHDPGLTLTRHGNEAWMSQTLNHDPAYWRQDAAEARGFEEPPVHPDYLTAATLGITVEDLSEKGGYFLGRTDVRFPTDAVYTGTELHVESEVVNKASSSSRPNYGIVSWRTRGKDAETGEVLCSYERTNMIPRRKPLETDGGAVENADEEEDEGLPAEFINPDGGYFEDFVEALEEAAGRDAAVAYRHERGRSQDDVTVAYLPLSTLNTAKQHHNLDVMADSPSGDIVTYGDVTRSTALGHARSDEQTYREVGFDDETFHTFVTPGDTVYAFTRVLDAEDSVEETSTGSRTSSENDGDVAGTVRFEHIAFNQNDEPVYSGIRTAKICKRGN